MLSIFDFTNYRKYLSGWIEAQGDLAYGLKGKIAKSLGVSSSLLSQIQKGEKSLTSDQAHSLAQFMGLGEFESDYLHLLVEVDRAGTPAYRERLRKKIANAVEQSKKLGTRVPRTHELNDEQRAIYYSSWIYTGIRNLTAVPEVASIHAIAEKLRLEPGVVSHVVKFLLESGLCVEKRGGLTYGPAAIHVDKESPFVNKHHQNWRMQGIQQMDRRRDADLFFTSPMSLSREAFSEIRNLLPTVVQNIMEISAPSDSETVACLNIDWFEYSY